MVAVVVVDTIVVKFSYSLEQTKTFFEDGWHYWP
jgi:hypothetical protein